MCHFDDKKIAGDKEWGRPDFPGDDMLLIEMYDHLYDNSAEFEDILFL